MNKKRHVFFWLCIACITGFLIGCEGRKKDRDEDEDKRGAQSTTTESAKSEKGETEMYGAEIQGGQVHNFSSDQEGIIAKGWSHDRTGKGSIGSWIIMKDPTAPSQPNVFAQISQDKTDYRFPVAIVDTSTYTDLQLSVKFKTVKGLVDQGAGLVWRYKDINNYYVVRANALEDNVNFYKVVDGRRKQLEGAGTKVGTNEWHTLIIKMKGETLECYFDGQRLFETADPTFPGPGKIGLWTKADSYILFDDFTTKSLDTK